MDRVALIQSYALGPQALRVALARLPAASFDWKPAAGQWSAREVVAHCADSEMNAAARIRYVVAEKQPVIQGYDQDLWAQALDYGAVPLEAAWAMIDATRAWTLPLIRSLSDAAWQKVGLHTESGRYAAADWLALYAEHLHVHARQLERIGAALQARA